VLAPETHAMLDNTLASGQPGAGWQEHLRQHLGERN
jgi:hypothetical protein